MTVLNPLLNDKRVDPDSIERQRFSSANLPAWARKIPADECGVAAVVPAWTVYGHFRAALEQFLGTG